MKKRRVNVYWGGSGYSCFWTPEGTLYYHPEQDRNILHETYGGENYYISLSGLSGAGFLQPRSGDVLVELGFYRTDTGPGPGHQKRRMVGETGEGRPIWGYAPVANGGLLKRNYPLVLTDGERIVFVNPYPYNGGADAGHFVRAIQGWDDLPWDEAREISVHYHEYAEKKDTKRFKLLSNGFRGVNALRFADLREVQDTAQSYMDILPGHRWMNILSAHVDRDDDQVVVFDPLFGYISDIFPYSPPEREWPGQINGWDVDTETPGLMFCYRQVNNFRVVAMAVNLETNEEFEEEFLAAGFDPETAQKELFRELRNKERRAAVIARMGEYSENVIRRTLEENPNMVISLADSTTAGNCEYGTKRFLEQFGLQESQTAQELLENPRFEEILRNAAFRKVVAYIRHRADMGVTANP